MSIYDKASLVLIPSGTKTSKVYSQKPVNGDGDFTFSRSTAATRVNADGNIEKETQNLLLQSNTFDTTWGNSNSTETSGQSGYDGSTDAWRIDKTASGGYLVQGIGTSGVQTFSVYAKAGTTDWMQLLTLGSGTGSRYVFYDLTNGVIGSQSGSGTYGIDSNIESVGGGWYRCSLTFNTTLNDVRIYPAEANSVSASSGNIYIQDAQLEQGLVARDYIETTTAAVEGGITDNVPRLDYTDSSCPALLLEPQRTNLVTQSELFDGFFNLQAAAQTENATTSPEGVQNAVKMYPTTTGLFKGYNKTFGSSLSNTAYTLSVYAKAAEFEHMFFYAIGAVGGTSGVWFNLSTGNVGTTQAAWSSAKMTDMGDGWYRCEATLTYQGSADYWYILAADADNSRTATASGTNGLYLYGAQMEEASYATSYIPTYGTSVTRNADLGDWVNNQIDTPILFGLNDDFTLYFNGQSIGDEIERTRFMLIGGGYFASGNDYRNRFWIREDNLLSLDGDGGITMGSAILSSDLPEQTDFKVLARKNGSTIDFFLNGQKQTTTQGTNSAFAVRSLFGSYNTFYTAYGSHKQILIFPEALSDDECITLTT